MASPLPSSLSDDEEHDPRMILIPLSKSAAKSLGLPKNQEKVDQAALPSNLDHVLPKECRGKTKGLYLYESLQVPYFVLGSEDRCDVLLETSDEECWVHLQHCLLIPGPTSDAIFLCNRSNTLFSVAPPGGSPSCNILPNSELKLNPGTWRLGLGAGLDFLIRVFPSSCHDVYTAAWLGPREQLNGMKDRTMNKSTEEKREGGEEEPSDKRAQPKPANTTSKSKLMPWDLIGETKAALVFKLLHRDKIIAAKMSRKLCVSEAAFAWVQEKSVLEALNHHSIVRFLSFNAPRLILYLEYIDGQDLSKHIDSQHLSRFEEDTAHKIWKDISSALEYIHKKDIVHNDIKPSNILLGSGDRGAVLVDFALASSATSSVLHNGGTSSYIAPEYISSQRGKPSDIWGFGITMLFVFGQTPLPRHNWRISDLKRGGFSVFEYLSWINKVDDIRNKLPPSLATLRRMLLADPLGRISASELHSICCEHVDKKASKKEALVTN